jgi:Tfp pilus assembly protein PilN
MAKNFTSINLLNNSKNGFLERAMNWALTVGRVLIIATELIALIAFLYRFGLDQQLIDLHTKIKQEQQIVQLQKQNEDAYRNLQDRLVIASLASSTSGKNVKIIKDIIGFAPIGMTFTNFTFSGSNLTLQANVNSVTALSIFISSLKSYPQIESVSLDKIENKTSSAAITITINVSLIKPQGGLNEVSSN